MRKAMTAVLYYDEDLVRVYVYTLYLINIELR